MGDGSQTGQKRSNTAIDQVLQRHALRAYDRQDFDDAYIWKHIYPSEGIPKPDSTAHLDDSRTISEPIPESSYDTVSQQPNQSLSLITDTDKVRDTRAHPHQTSLDLDLSHRLGLVSPPVQLIHAGEVVSARPDVVEGSLGRVFDGVVVLLSKLGRKRC